MNKIFLILSLIVTTTSCSYTNQKNKNHSKDTLTLLTKTKWNIDLNNIDSLRNYSHSPLFFDKENIYFYNQRVGDFEFKHETLLIKEISYLQMRIDSFVREEKIRMIAKIQKIDNDSLIFIKIGGRGLPFVQFDNYRYIPSLSLYKFYNDTLNFNKKTDFLKVSLSSSPCYGQCPLQAIEIDSNGDYKFYGGKYSKRQGNFVGKTNNTFIDSLKYLMTAALINRDNLSNIPPIDAPQSDIIICFNKNDTLKISGYPGDFPIRLYELYSIIMNSYKTAQLAKTDKPIKFMTKKHLII